MYAPLPLPPARVRHRLIATSNQKLDMVPTKYTSANGCPLVYQTLKSEMDKSLTSGIVHLCVFLVVTKNHHRLRIRNNRLSELKVLYCVNGWSLGGLFQAYLIDSSVTFDTVHPSPPQNSQLSCVTTLAATDNQKPDRVPAKNIPTLQSLISRHFCERMPPGQSGDALLS